MTKPKTYTPVVTGPGAQPADAFTELPADPIGWRVLLDDDGRWRPVADGRDVELGPFDTKREAVAAVADHDNPA